MGTPAIGKRSLFRKGLPNRIKFSESSLTVQAVEKLESDQRLLSPNASELDANLRLPGQRPIHFRAPIRGVRVVAWVGDVLFPRRTAYPKSVCLDPSLDGGVGLGKSFVKYSVSF
jgi:hypothetical protein